MRRLGTRGLPAGAVSAFKNEKLHGGHPSNNDDPLQPAGSSAEVKGPIFNRDNVWKFDPTAGFGSFGGTAHLNAAHPGLLSHFQLLQAAQSVNCSSQVLSLFQMMFSIQNRIL